MTQFVVVAAQGLPDAGEVARGEVFEMPFDDTQRQRTRLRRGQAFQLQRQAFLRAARTNARRIEVLQVAQGDAEFFQQGFAQLVVFADQQVDQLVQWLRQVAVVTQGFDQEADQRPIAIGQLGHRHLRAEMLAQGARGGLGFTTVGIVVVGIALAVAAGKVHAPAFVVTTAGFLALLALVAFGGCDGLWRDRLIARRAEAEQGRFAWLIPFQQGIFLQSLIYFGVQLQRRQLQEPDRLLQLRRQCQVLRKPELESLPHFSCS
jgi:hypothetical protein